VTECAFIRRRAYRVNPLSREKNQKNGLVESRTIGVGHQIEEQWMIHQVEKKARMYPHHSHLKKGK